MIFCSYVSQLQVLKQNKRSCRETTWFCSFLCRSALSFGRFQVPPFCTFGRCSSCDCIFAHCLEPSSSSSSLLASSSSASSSSSDFSSLIPQMNAKEQEHHHHHYHRRHSSSSSSSSSSCSSAAAAVDSSSRDNDGDEVCHVVVVLLSILFASCLLSDFAHVHDAVRLPVLSHVWASCHCFVVLFFPLVE